jgi:hypothetical protein
MNLQLLQTSLIALIKSRGIPLPESDEYFNKIKSSDNLLLIRKIALWWRRIQTERFCVLTTNLLKIRGDFDAQLSGFISENTFSPFREEVGIQFLNYLISKNIDPLARSVAEFEIAIIKLKRGENIECMITLEYEPYSLIRGLLRNTLNIKEINKGTYNVVISSRNKEELFKVV